jgi:hypothetical protein
MCLCTKQKLYGSETISVYLAHIHTTFIFNIYHLDYCKHTQSFYVTTKRECHHSLPKSHIQSTDRRKALHIILSIYIPSPDYHTFTTMHYKSTSNTAEMKKGNRSVPYFSCLSKIGHHHTKCQENPW